MTEKPLVVIVDDENDIAELIAISLKKAGFQVKVFADGHSFFRQLPVLTPHLFILDLMLPDMDGLDICKQLRQQQTTAQLPIIMVTAKTEETDRVVGLELGADDYVTKPFSAKELVARVRALLRRQTYTTAAIQPKTGGLVIDTERYQVLLDGVPCELTTTEFKILQILSRKPGIVYSRDTLLDHLWGTEKIVIDRTIDVHVKHLREKLGTYGAGIKNVRGVGYKYEEER